MHSRSMQASSPPIDDPALFASWNARRSRGLSLPELLDEMDAYESPLPLSHLKDLLDRLVATPEDFRNHVRFDPSRYLRNSVRARPHYEALVLCWLPEQLSPIHDHGESCCAVGVLSGEAIEIGFLLNPDGTLRLRSSERLAAGSITASVGQDMHQVASWARPARPLITLHIYSPPLLQMHVYPQAQVKRVSASEVTGLTGGISANDRLLTKDCA